MSETFVEYLPSNGVIAKIAICDLDLLFEGQELKIYRQNFAYSHRLVRLCVCVCSSNGVNIFHDRDLLFEGQI